MIVKNDKRILVLVNNSLKPIEHFLQMLHHPVDGVAKLSDLIIRQRLKMLGLEASGRSLLRNAQNTFQTLNDSLKIEKERDDNNRL